MKRLKLISHALPLILATLIYVASLPLRALGQKVPDAKGKISGRVIGPDGRPAADARVNLYLTGHTHLLPTITDQKGRFSFSQLPSGLFSLSASKGGFVSRTSSPDDAAPIRIGDDDEVADIELHLEKGGVVTGKVTREGGEPVILANISLTDADGNLAGSGDLQRIHFVTDDRGIYRVFGVPGGRYLVRVDLLKSASTQQLNSTVYYPGVGSSRHATPIAIVNGSETRDIDLSIKSTPDEGGAIKGVVAGTDGYGLRNVSINAYADDSSTRASARTNEDGSYEFKDLPQGNYTVEVYSHDSKLVERTRSKVTVVGSDQVIANMTVEAAGLLYGKFEMEDGSTPVGLGSISISAMLERPGYQVSGAIAPTGRFLVQRVSSGPVQIQVNTGASPVFAVKVVRDQEDLPDWRLNMGVGDRVENLRIILSNQGAVLTGIVRQSSADAPAPGAWISAVPVDAERRAVRGAIRVAPADSRGRFAISGIAPGQYFVLACRNPRSMPADPSGLEAWLLSHRSSEVAVDFKPKSEQAIALRVID